MAVGTECKTRKEGSVNSMKKYVYFLVGLIAVVEALKGVSCSIPVALKLRRSDKLYKLVDASEIKLQ